MSTAGRPGERSAADQELGADAQTDAAPAEGDAARPRGRGRHRRKKKHRPFWIEIPMLLALSLGLTILVKTFLVAAFYIPSGSMEQTLLLQDRVLVNKLSYRFGEVKRGDIVVFRGPPSWTAENPVPPPPTNPITRLLQPLQRALGAAPPGEKDFIKRVIGLPGDRVECCDADGRVSVNGVALDESSYLFEDNQDEFSVVVPDDHLWMMGDHRAVSQDSRAEGQGAVPIDNVVGRAFVVIWPLGHAKGLGRPDTTPAAAPAATLPVAVAAVGLPLAVRRRRRTLVGS
jgi:signal peptidase I